MQEIVQHALLHVDEHGPRLERPDWARAVSDREHVRRLAPAVDILEEGAQRVVVAAARVVRGVLTEGELPEAAADLVPALANLCTEERTRHRGRQRAESALSLGERVVQVRGAQAPGL